MHRILRAAVTIVVVLLVCGTATAATQTILGKRFQVKSSSADPARRTVAGQGQERGSSNTVVGDPTAAGASLEVIANGATDTSQIFDLPAAGWSRVGTLGFRFSNAKVGGAVKRASIKKTPNGTFQIRVAVSGRDGGVGVVPPNPGDDGGFALTLAFGDRYCVGFGGIAGGVEAKDDARTWSIRRASAEACPGGGGPVTTTTTTTQPGATTTSLAPCTTTTGPSTTTTTIPLEPPCEFGNTTGCDTFYLPPDPIPALPPGTLLDSRPVAITGSGIATPFQAWQLKFVSTDVRDEPSVGIATLILPLTCPLTMPRPLVSYQTAEDSLSMLCAPSYRMRAGTEKEEVSLPPLLEQGWAVVVPDYEGLQSAYTAGIQAAHGVLDAIRAAASFAPGGLAGTATPVGLWGYSGGGLASAWASELAPTYAPELNLVAVAAGGVPPDITAVAKNLDGGPFSSIMLAGSVGMSRAYPELTSLWNAQGLALAEEIGDQCIETYAVQYPFQTMDTYTTVPNAICLPWVQDIMALNHLGGRTPAGPMYIFHAVADELIPMADVNALVTEYCSEGVTVTYYQDVASDHISLAVSGAPAAVSYMGSRFAGLPAPSTCGLPMIPPLMPSVHCDTATTTTTAPVTTTTDAGATTTTTTSATSSTLPFQECGVFPTCDGSCPAGQVCSRVFADPVGNDGGCHCVDGDTPCNGLQMCAANGDCPAGTQCFGNPVPPNGCGCFQTSP